MPELRFRFVKEGRAAYLSHLDVMRTFQRAFIRAGMQVKHSEGFNPHPKMSIAMPLQLGCESRCEALDVSLLEKPENAVERLNRALPEGIRVLSQDVPVMQVKHIAWTEWRLRFASETDAADAAEALGRDSLPVEKKTKRGFGMLDIAPHIALLGREGRELAIRLKAAEPTVNCTDVQKAVFSALPEQKPFKALRTGLKTADLQDFQ